MSDGAEAPQGADTPEAPSGDDYGGAELAEALQGAEAPESADAPDLVDVLDIDDLGDLESRRVKMKVDGEEVVLSLKDALKGTQRAKASTKKMEEAARIRRQASEELRQLLEDPEAYATKGGAEVVDKAIERWVNSSNPQVQKAVERAFQRLLEDQQMTPQQREARDRENALKQREARLEEFERKQQEEKQSHEVAQLRERLQADLSQALESRGFAPTPYAIARVASAMHGAHERGVELSAEEATELAIEERQAEIQGDLGALEGDSLLERLGPEIVRKVNQATVARLRGRPATPQKAQDEEPREPGDEGLSSEEFRRKYGTGMSVF